MDRRCSSCGGFCKKSGCEREHVKPKEWQGLTDYQVAELFYSNDWCDDYAVFEPFARAIEAALKAKNA